MKQKNPPVSPMQVLYSEGRVSPSRAGSLRLILAGSILGTLFTSITSTGTMLAGYFDELGGSGLAFGILNAIPFLAAVVQVPASVLVSRTGARKKYRILYGVISRALWIAIGLIPFFVPAEPAWLRIYGLCLLLGISSVCGAFPEVTYGSWLADLVPRNIRGRWLSIRDIACNIAGIAIGLGCAAFMEFLPGLTGYAVIFTFGGLIGIADMLCYLKVEDVPMPADSVSNIWPVAKQIFRDKPFFNFMLFWAFWLFTAYLASPYTNFYALQKMELSISTVTIHGQVIPAVVGILVSPFWGALIDKLGNKRVMFLSCALTSLVPAIFVFAVPGESLTFFLYNLLGSAVWSIPFLVSLNMMLCNSPHRDRTSYVALFQCFTELFGSFLGVLLGGGLIELLPALLSAWGNAAADEYKVLFVLSALLRLFATFLFVPRLHDKENTPVADPQ